MRRRADYMHRIAQGVLTILAVVIWTMATGLTSAHAALLDGLLEGVSESLGKRAEEKGETLVLGNFYPPETPDSHGPIGMMGDHTHNEGEFMATYRYMNMFMGGNMNGNDDVSDSEVTTQFGFPVAPTDMRMTMDMLSAMYGVNQTLTLTVMVPYLHKSMHHVNNVNGVTFETKTSGLGDITLGSLWRLYAVESPSLGAHRFHLNFGVGLPTGSIKEDAFVPAGAAVRRLPYPMQLGSGTVDLYPGITYTGGKSRTSWGFQYIATFRLGENSQDYTVGNGNNVTGWGAYRWVDWMSTSLRLDWRQWGNYDGADPNLNTPPPPLPNVVETAVPSLRGGQRLDLLAGVNMLLPNLGSLENRLAVEGGTPIMQRLDGPQLKTSWMLVAGWQLIF